MSTQETRGDVYRRAFEEAIAAGSPEAEAQLAAYEAADAWTPVVPEPPAHEPPHAPTGDRLLDAAARAEAAEDLARRRAWSSRAHR
jgi:hypothetical protein